MVVLGLVLLTSMESSAIDVVVEDAAFTPVVTEGFTEEPWSPDAPTDSPLFQKAVVGPMHSAVGFLFFVDDEVFKAPSVRVISQTPAEGDVIDPSQTQDIMMLFMDGQASLGYGLHDLEEDNFEGVEFRVIHKCLRQGTAVIEASVLTYWVIDDEESVYDPTRQTRITWSWTKECARSDPIGSKAYRSGFRIGTTHALDDVVRTGATRFQYDPDTPAITVPVSEHSSSFFLSMEEGFGNQYHEGAIAVSSPDWLHVTVRGDASVPNVVTGFDVQELDIIYNCGPSASGAAKVTITLHLDLYGPISFSYLKHCGGVEKEGFYVSSSPEKAGDVVMDGSVVPEYNYEMPTHVTSEIEYMDSFYIHAEDLRSATSQPQEFGTPIVTVSPSGLMRPVLEGSASTAGSVGRAPKKLDIYYNCRQRGEGRVTVTIPVPMHTPVEFSWIKQCVRRQARDSVGFLSPNQLLVFLCVIVVSIGFGLWLMNRKKKQAQRQLLLSSQKMSMH